MNLKVKVLARALSCAGALAVATLLASCGGGGEVAKFYPGRIIAFGDENSVITATGNKYTVNALSNGSTTTVDCASNPIWIQTLANNYGMVFPQCNTTQAATPQGTIWATAGATVSDLSGQIDEQVNLGGFTSTDFVTVFVGVNDVVQQFNTYPTQSEAQITANLTATAISLAQQVNRLAGYGAKVLVSTIPDVGLTPFAGDRTAGSTNTNPALLSRLSGAFNDALLANLLNDGHQIGLIQLDQYLSNQDSATVNNTSGQSYGDTYDVACTTALPKCTTNTLVPNAQTTTFMWADNLHMGPVAQQNFGSLAVQRATGNPF